MQSQACTGSKKHCPRSEFMLELHRWISKLTVRHVQILHGRSFDHLGKGSGNFVEKRALREGERQR